MEDVVRPYPLVLEMYASPVRQIRKFWRNHVDVLFLIQLAKYAGDIAHLFI